MTRYDDQLSQYVHNLFAVEDEALRRAREDTPKRGLPPIGVTAEEGRFLQFLARASGGNKALEIGTLGGYSGIWIARGLEPGGRLITVEKDPTHAAVARDHFAAAGVSDRVEVRVGDAHLLLSGLAAEGPFEFVFIDAEKIGYVAYFDWALANTQIGGIIAAHNAFRGGRVAQAHNTEADTVILRTLARRISAEPRVVSTVFPAGDGTLIAVKVA